MESWVLLQSVQRGFWPCPFSQKERAKISWLQEVLGPGRHRELEEGEDLHLKSSSFFQTSGVVFFKITTITMTHDFHGWCILITNASLFCVYALH